MQSPLSSHHPRGSLQFATKNPNYPCDPSGHSGEITLTPHPPAARRNDNLLVPSLTRIPPLKLQPEWVGKFNAFLISGLSLGQGSWYFYCEGLSPLVIIEIHNIHQRSLILLLWKEQHPDQPPEGFLSQSNQIICNLNKSFYKHVPSQLSIT